MAKILVVDDERIIANSMFRVLTRSGHSVLVANNGLEAIQIIEAEAGNPFDIIFMDLLMPEIGGAEVLDLVKSKMPNTKVLMMTAYGDMSAREDLLRRGALQVLSKPFEDMTKVPNLVEQLLGSSSK